jgi:phosphatidate cytidylyltransferase
LVKLSPQVSLGWWLAGFSYVGAPLVAMWWLRTLDAGLLVLWVFFIVWATDIGGYFFGKGIGGPKLAPSISPKKTWAGLIGGVAFSVAAALALHFIFGLLENKSAVILASGLLAVWAQVGDLVESAIKRHFGVKDSGELIPGHGGLLDRVDGLVFVAPAMAMLIIWYPTVFLAGS